MKHIIVSRVNLHLDLDPWKYTDTAQYKDPKWQLSRLWLLNTYARASLSRQHDQDFEFVTLWQKGELIKEGKLENEIQIEIERTGTPDDDPLDYMAASEGRDGKMEFNYSNQVADKINAMFKAPLLFGTLDIDDCLHKDFIGTLHRSVNETRFSLKHPYYWSTITRYCYNIITGEKGQKKRACPSPFVTCWEPGPDIIGYAYRYEHSYLNRFVKRGKNVPGLIALQTVHDTNKFSRSVGEPAEFDLNYFL